MSKYVSLDLSNLIITWNYDLFKMLIWLGDNPTFSYCYVICMLQHFSFNHLEL